jgi:hypothetical protein
LNAYWELWSDEGFQSELPPFGERAVQASNTKIDSIIFKNLGPTSQITACTSIIKTDVHMVFRDIIAVCSDQNVEHLNTEFGQNKQDRA